LWQTQAIFYSEEALEIFPARSAFALAILACCGSVYADNAPIVSVVLYPGTATVERAAHVAAGTTQLELDGLPSNFDMETLRVQGHNGVQIGQVVAKDQAHSEAFSAREADLEAKIQALQDKKAELDSEAKSAVLVNNYLEHLNGGDKSSAPTDARALAALLEGIRRGSTDAYERMQKVAVQTRELDKKIKALESDLRKVRNGSRSTRSLLVYLRAPQAGDVHLSYQVDGAGWQPTYRASLDSASSTIGLERMAMVSQKTGEDWTGVKMKLSSGQPRLLPQAPEPRPWLLTYQPPQAQQKLYNYAAAPAAAPRAAAGAALQRIEVTGSSNPDYVAPVLENQGNFNTEFEVPAMVSLASDGRELTVPLAKQTMAVTQRIRVAPRIDTNAVVTVEAAKPEGVWLNGDIQLFRDGSYVGATHWNTQASDRLELSFGRDDLVRVTVDRAKQKSGSAGFISRENERTVADLYTVTSRHKTPIDILVLESSPVSTSDQVKVTSVFDPKPTIDTWEKRQGVMGWEKTLAPNESAKFNVAYTIGYPKEGSVSGLP
jgi:uncharacterized protein (TIGR02231 family)